MLGVVFILNIATGQVPNQSQPKNLKARALAPSQCFLYHNRTRCLLTNNSSSNSTRSFNSVYSNNHHPVSMHIQMHKMYSYTNNLISNNLVLCRTSKFQGIRSQICFRKTYVVSIPPECTLCPFLKHFRVLDLAQLLADPMSKKNLKRRSKGKENGLSASTTKKRSSGEKRRRS